MSRRPPLPGELPVQVRRFVEELRLHKDRSGLSLAALAAKTAYSRASWHRCLNGRALPPWPPVDTLGRLVDADRARLRVLWESAAETWKAAEQDTKCRTGGAGRGTDGAEDRSGRGAADGGPSGFVGPARGGRGPRRVRVAAVGAVVAAAALAVVMVVRPWQDESRTAAGPPGAPAGDPPWPWALRPAGTRPEGADCRGRACRGRDPFREGCDRDGTTVHTLTAFGRTLSLHYSPACRAVWAEVSPARGTTRLLVTGSGSGVTVRTAHDGQSHTAMADAGPDAARASVGVAGHQLGVTAHDSWADPVNDGSGRA
ncbi:DUF2690 domain-containing protein [Streptomyces sp. NPDC002004]